MARDKERLDADRKTLRALWATQPDGTHLSTAEIGRRMGKTKNAIVGMAHRMDLPARPSPIKRADNPVMRQRNESIVALSETGLTGPTVAARLGVTPETVYGVMAAHRKKHASPATTLPPLSSLADMPVRASEPRVYRQGQRLPPRSLELTTSVAAPMARPAAYGRIVSCCWPIGEPGTKAFRFCGDPSMPGKSYCEGHAKIAFVPVRSRVEDVHAL